MTEGVKKLKQDLAYLQAMVRDLTNYLYSNVVYWPSLEEGFPQLTLGGYIMRQRRLQILAYWLTETEQNELKQAVIQYKDVTSGLTAILEKKATEELKIRLDQWEQNLTEYWDAEVIEEEYFKTDAQVRTIITDLVVMLGMHPYHLDQKLVLRLDKLDAELQANWKVGEFIWPEEWIPAYGMGDYWFLYGVPVVEGMGLQENQEI